MSQAPPTASPARPLPALGFLVVLLALAAMAIATLRTPPRIITGLPEGTRVGHARAALGDRLRIESGELRFQAVLAGGAGEATASQVSSAETWILAAMAQQPFEPRLHAALACLDLATLRLETAERHYRDALELAPSYGEARLGLGVTLALRATAESDAARARGLWLRAIAQFAAVPMDDPCHEAALYDRVLLLMRVERAEEAKRWARVYLERDAFSPWAMVLIRELPGVGKTDGTNKRH
jgi:Flp pilus assembly protein TadD